MKATGAGAAIVAAAAGIALVAGGSALVARDLASARRACELARKVHSPAIRQTTTPGDTHEQAATSGVDLTALRAENPDAIGWLFVEGTAVDTPLVQADPSRPHWYLSHDFWGEPNPLGCPYLDARCSAQSTVLMAYGHHVQGTHEAFSDLSDSCAPAAFATLGSCVWDTGDGNPVALSPLCSLRVDSDDELVASAATWTSDELDERLQRLCERSEARCDDWAQGCARARHALLLVTCSSALPGQTERTITTYIV